MVLVAFFIEVENTKSGFNTLIRIWRKLVVQAYNYTRGCCIVCLTLIINWNGVVRLGFLESTRVCMYQ